MNALARARDSRLLSRVKAILLTPRDEWQVIAAERATVAQIYRGYVMPLAAIGPIATFVGTAIVGVQVPLIGAMRTPLLPALTQALIAYALSLAAIGILALLINGLAPRFGGTRDLIAALKLAAYSSTAAWVAGVFAVLPSLATLGFLGLYSLYLLYLGLPVLMRVAAPKILGYVGTVTIAALLISLVIGTVGRAPLGSSPSISGSPEDRSPVSGGTVRVTLDDGPDRGVHESAGDVRCLHETLPDPGYHVANYRPGERLQLIFRPDRSASGNLQELVVEAPLTSHPVPGGPTILFPQSYLTFALLTVGGHRYVLGNPSGIGEDEKEVSLDTKENTTTLRIAGVTAEGFAIRVAIGCSALVAADASPPPPPTPRPVQTDRPRNAPPGVFDHVQRLVDEILEAPDLVTTVTAVREVLARAGVPTLDYDGAVLTPAIGPAGRTSALAEETIRLALELRASPEDNDHAVVGRMTQDDLDQMLRDFGWTWKWRGAYLGDRDLSNYTEADFNGMFIDEMVRKRTGESRDGESRGRVWLTSLELYVYAAAFDRATASLEAGSSSGGAPLARLAALDPCSQIKKELSPAAWGRDLTVETASQLDKVYFGKIIEAVLQRYGVDEAGVELVKRALTAVSMAAKVWKLAVLYRHADVDLSILDLPRDDLHKPDRGTRPFTFRVTTGITERDSRAYQSFLASAGWIRAMRDCADFHGLPVFPDIGDIAGELEKWRVEWYECSGFAGSPKHAEMSVRKNRFDVAQGTRKEMTLRRFNEHAVYAEVIVDLLAESAGHPTSRSVAGYDLRSAPILVTARIRTHQLPSADTIRNVLGGNALDIALGLADSITELAAGWFQAIVTPSATAGFIAYYHVQRAVPDQGPQAGGGGGLPVWAYHEAGECSAAFAR